MGAFPINSNSVAVSASFNCCFIQNYKGCMKNVSILKLNVVVVRTAVAIFVKNLLYSYMQSIIVTMQLIVTSYYSYFLDSYSLSYQLLNTRHVTSYVYYLVVT